MLVLLASSINWGPPLVRRAQVMYWQHRCLDPSISLDARSNAWKQFGSAKHSIAPLFIGQMQNEFGQRKLVYVGEDGNDLKQGLRLTVVWRVVEPGNLLREPYALSTGEWTLETYFDHFAPAQIDSADASHLILKTETVGYIVDVWLRGEKLIVEPRQPSPLSSLTTRPFP